MSEKFNPNNIQNDEFNFNTEESEYKNLINRLKEISETIALVEKIIYRSNLNCD